MTRGELGLLDQSWGRQANTTCGCTASGVSHLVGEGVCHRVLRARHLLGLKAGKAARQRHRRCVVGPQPLVLHLPVAQHLAAGRSGREGKGVGWAGDPAGNGAGGPTLAAPLFATCQPRACKLLPPRGVPTATQPCLHTLRCPLFLLPLRTCCTIRVLSPCTFTCRQPSSSAAASPAIRPAHAHTGALAVGAAHAPGALWLATAAFHQVVWTRGPSQEVEGTVDVDTTRHASAGPPQPSQPRACGHTQPAFTQSPRTCVFCLVVGAEVAHVLAQAVHLRTGGEQHTCRGAGEDGNHPCQDWPRRLRARVPLRVHPSSAHVGAHAAGPAATHNAARPLATRFPSPGALGLECTRKDWSIAQDPPPLPPLPRKSRPQSRRARGSAWTHRQTPAKRERRGRQGAVGSTAGEERTAAGARGWRARALVCAAPRHHDE